jgi:lysophospholipase L1-like esterase
MIGTNDLGMDVSQEHLLANYTAILDRLAHESPETAVIVQSVLPRAAAFTGRVQALNAALAPLARAHGAVFVDLTPVFAGANGAILPEYSNDELHLLGAGYDAWRRAIAPHLAAAL